MTSLVRLLVPASLATLLAGLYAPDFGFEVDSLLLGARFGIDAVNRPFLVVTGLAWLAAGLAAGETVLRHARGREALAHGLAMLGNVLAVLARDPVTFYTGFAVMSLAAYGMVLATPSAAQRFAGRVYVTLAIAGELLLFAAMVGLVHAGGTRFPLELAAPAPDWLTLCIVLGFGIKAGLVPLHVALPLVYRAAPLAAGIALAGAALNAGILGWLRWLPVPEAGAWSGGLLVALGLVGYLYAVLVGLTQAHPRALLGYSSISQVALMAVAIGVGIAAPEHWPAVLAGVVVMMTHHAVAKTYLFAASGCRPRTPLARGTWWTGVALAGLGLAGAPLTGGYAAKAALAETLALLPALEALGAWLWVSSALTTLLMVRFAWLMRRRRAAVAPRAVGAARLVAFAALAAVTVMALASGPWRPGTVLASALPIAAVLLVALAMLRGRTARPHAASRLVVRVPAGDVVRPVVRWLGAAARAFGPAIRRSADRLRHRPPAIRLRGLPAWMERSAGAPDPDWASAAAAVLGCVVVLAVALMLPLG